ncbi:hypothetical protein [Kitasatospora sp. NBC_01266]|uniref:hypothetical protein n=1 Tax=Kitasatospora sp. NBC_01266 TaxID=2903572 RepID=UPI002E34573E|nr:hypothetical protein [Kitasatospora sp. NBC_01266]
MTSSTLATAIAVVGLVGGFGLLGLLLRRDPDLPDGPATAATTPRPQPRPNPRPQPLPANPDRLRGTLPAASDLRLGTLVRWTSSSAPRPRQISTPRAR